MIGTLLVIATLCGVAILITVLLPTTPSDSRRPEPKHRNFPRQHEHEFVYHPRTLGGWGTVTCADPACSYLDIY